MISNAKEFLRKKLLLKNPTLADIASSNIEISGLPFQRMEQFLIENGPYEFLTTEIGLDTHRSQIIRELRDFQAKMYGGISVGLGEITLALQKGCPQNIKALALIYLGDIVSFDAEQNEGVSHSTAEVGNVILLEDGVVAWFYASSRIPFSVIGFSYPEEMREQMKYGIVHPKNPKVDIPKYMKDELAGYLNGLELADRIFMFDYKVAQKPELGQSPFRKPEPAETAEIINPRFDKPIVKVSVTEMVDYITDTKSFRALPDMIEACLKAYTSVKD